MAKDRNRRHRGPEKPDARSATPKRGVTASSLLKSAKPRSDSSRCWTCCNAKFRGLIRSALDQMAERPAENAHVSTYTLHRELVEQAGYGMSLTAFNNHVWNHERERWARVEAARKAYAGG